MTLGGFGAWKKKKKIFFWGGGGGGGGVEAQYYVRLRNVRGSENGAMGPPKYSPDLDK